MCIVYISNTLIILFFWWCNLIDLNLNLWVSFWLHPKTFTPSFTLKGREKGKECADELRRFFQHWCHLTNLKCTNILLSNVKLWVHMKSNVFTFTVAIHYLMSLLMTLNSHLIEKITSLHEFWFITSNKFTTSLNIPMKLKHLNIYLMSFGILRKISCFTKGI